VARALHFNIDWVWNYGMVADSGAIYWAVDDEHRLHLHREGALRDMADATDSSTRWKLF
jgi:hypothetical protein